MQHAKTPWRIDPIGTIIRGENNTEVCTIDSGWRDWEANAKFIVQACNSHDALVEALMAVYQDIELQNVKGGSDELNLMIQVALAKAGGTT